MWLFYYALFIDPCFFPHPCENDVFVVLFNRKVIAYLDSKMEIGI